jgi:hypothetical protein
MSVTVIPAQAGISGGKVADLLAETPAFAGVTALPPDGRHG